ncbi:hypothetical protein ASE70_01240 [Sphingomonas sp. Leaf22]|uniref:UrcA family protein n=1 Tax=Sphingomonas sp. Leaf22 TaxID=1735687 RepID=UPI0006F73507|nr:UrcA family protein [Sphingomonas sp. Leaf22]KQM95374.1 hypothetical protein ASE70_01240 [Sphingomonas sp. Leaf22]
MNIRIIALAATAFACLSSAANAEVREPVSVHVSYAGLDLTKIEHRRVLDARIDRAATTACRSSASGLRRYADENRCRAEMRRDAQVQVAQLQPVAVASVK